MAKKPENDIGKSLRIAMAATGVTNKQLASDLGLASDMNITYYRNQKKLRDAIVEELAAYFKMTKADFIALAHKVPVISES